MVIVYKLIDCISVYIQVWRNTKRTKCYFPISHLLDLCMNFHLYTASSDTHSYYLLRYVKNIKRVLLLYHMDKCPSTNQRGIKNLKRYEKHTRYV